MMSFKSYFFQASILLLLLFITPLFARLNVKVSSEVINDICSETINPSFCLGLLNSTPGTSTADLQGLAKIILSLANSNATTTLNVIKSLIPKTKDPKLKESYQSCSKHYDNAIRFLKECETYLNQRNYNGMDIEASAAITEAADCNGETKDLAVDPSIKKGNQDLYQICEIIGGVANLLRG